MLLRVKEFLERAEEGILDKNYDEFLISVGGAQAFIDNTDDLSEILYVKAKGLYMFKKFGSAITTIEEALDVTRDNKKTFKLSKAKALILAYKGHYREALRLFKELLTKTQDRSLLIEAYINITWVMLEEYKREANLSVIEEIKIYLDTAYENVQELDDPKMKRIIFNNYAEYFKLRRDFDMAIEMLEQVIPLSEEDQLCEIYHSLAQLYFEQGNSDLMEKYLHDAELLASRFDNDLVLAKVLYTSAIAKLKKGDYIRVMDSLCIAFYNFMNCGAYNYAYDCFGKINEVSDALKYDCAEALKEQFKNVFSDTAFTDII